MTKSDVDVESGGVGNRIRELSQEMRVTDGRLNLVNLADIASKFAALSPPPDEHRQRWWSAQRELALFWLSGFIVRCRFNLREAELIDRVNNNLGQRQQCQSGSSHPY